MVDERDIYRDTPVRLIGYANEIGEAFRHIIHKNVVRASYGVAILYVLADTFDKTKKASKQERKKDHFSTSKVLYTTIDTLLWQGLASVIIPGFTINRICALTFSCLTKFTTYSTSFNKKATAAVGLSSIPFIVTPIDKFVDFLMDVTLRPLLGIK